jgi:superfamily I DNA/RNA helicase
LKRKGVFDMRISQVNISNYRNIDGISIFLNSECNYIIGENNLGKSNFLTLLNTVCGGKGFDDKDFFNSEKPIEVDIKIKLLLSEDKYTLLLDIFENKQLKQAMEYVDSQVILSTVHGAKGLEWDYVFIADVERWVFPGYYICNVCVDKFTPPVYCRSQLRNPMPDDFKETALDELSVFYVVITRSRNQVFISASAKGLDNYGEKNSNFSCLSSINGIKLIKAV